MIKAARAAKADLGDLDLANKTGLSYKNAASLPAEYLKAPIFINEAVSKGTRLLLLKAIKLKKEKRIHTAWTYLVKVFIRKAQSAKPEMVDSDEKLNQFV